MEHSIALVTGATSGVGHEAAHILAEEGWREVIITGRALARSQETANQLVAETRKKVFTPLELELDSLSSVQSALAELAKRGRPVDFLLLNAGMVGGKERVLTAAGIEVAQSPLIGHHQLTVGLLRANLLSRNARIVVAGSEAARGDIPSFSYTDVAQLAAKNHHDDLAAAVEATGHMPTQSSSLRGGPPHWRAGYPLAWLCTPSRRAPRPIRRWCETAAWP
jgi:NADP-dependent 3-hydroxy acid dehydrogenase YdfG